MRLVRIAHRLRSGGQDVPEHRLTVGGTAGRPPCAPSGGRSRNPAPLPRWRRTAWRTIRYPHSRSGHGSPGWQAAPAPRRSPGWPRARASAHLPSGSAARRHLPGNSGPHGIRPRRCRHARRGSAAGRPAWHSPCSISRTARRNAAADESATGRRSRRAHRPYRSPARGTVVGNGLTARASLRRQPEGRAPADIAGPSACRP